MKVQTTASHLDRPACLRGPTTMELLALLLVRWWPMLAADPQQEPTGGWGSLVLQGGAFGLVCILVLYIIPQHLRESRKEREQRDKEAREERERLADRFDRIIVIVQDKFEARNKDIVAAVKEQTSTLDRTFEEGLSRMEIAVHASCRVPEGRRGP